MIEWKHGDVLDSDAFIICHQVNCQGEMNSGLAKQIRTKYPDVFNLYRTYYESGSLKLGAVVYGFPFIIPNPLQLIANLCSQDNFGYDGKQYANYTAFRQCLQNIANTWKGGETTIAFPYKIGCGLGGGNWETMYKIIKEELKDYNVEIWRKDNE